MATQPGPVGSGRIRAGAEIECIEPYELPNPFDPSGVFRIERGTKSKIVVAGHKISVGPFDYRPGGAPGHVSHDSMEFRRHWRVLTSDPPRVRGKRAMIISDLGTIVELADTDYKHCKLIGFWAHSDDPDQDYYEDKGLRLPWPGDFVDMSWDLVERDRVARYLETPDFVVGHCMGLAPCRLGCRREVGSADLCDGTFYWPEGFSHYIRVHGVRPPEEFLAHVRNVR